MGPPPGRPGRRPGRSLVDTGRTVLVAAVVAVAALNGGFDPLLLLSAAGAVAIRWLRIPPVDEVAVVTALVMTGLSSALRLYDSFPVYDHVVHYPTGCRDRSRRVNQSATWSVPATAAIPMPGTSSRSTRPPYGGCGASDPDAVTSGPWGDRSRSPR